MTDQELAFFLILNAMPGFNFKGFQEGICLAARYIREEYVDSLGIRSPGGVFEETLSGV